MQSIRRIWEEKIIAIHNFGMRFAWFAMTAILNPNLKILMICCL
jgi:hypothetical protein